MIWIGIDCIGFTMVACNDATYYFFQFIPEGFFDQVFAALYREDILNVKLCISVWHFIEDIRADAPMCMVRMFSE